MCCHPTEKIACLIYCTASVSVLPNLVSQFQRGSTPRIHQYASPTDAVNQYQNVMCGVSERTRLPRMCIFVSCFFLLLLITRTCRREQTRNLQRVETTKRPVEKKPSTLNNQSSLLAVYSVLHYITIPLACQTFAYPSHLLAEAVDHKWQPYAAWCATLQNYYCDTKSQEKWKMALTRNGVQNQSRGFAVIDGASQSRWANAYALFSLPGLFS